MNPTNKVQTRQPFKKWLESTNRPVMVEEVWNAALDSVILPKPIKVIGVYASLDGCVSSSSHAFEDHVPSTKGMHQCFIFPDIRPLPQTVDLTDDEKLHEVEQAMKKLSEDSAIAVVRDLAKQLTGKTLDQLCTEYNVPTTREM